MEERLAGLRWKNRMEGAEIRVSTIDDVQVCVDMAAAEFKVGKKWVTITAEIDDEVLTKAVTTAEIIGKRFKGLHQTTTIMRDHWYAETGKSSVKGSAQPRNVVCIDIKLSKDALDATLNLPSWPVDPVDEKGQGKSTSWGAAAAAKHWQPFNLKNKGEGKGKWHPCKGQGKNEAKGEPGGTWSSDQVRQFLVGTQWVSDGQHDGPQILPTGPAHDEDDVASDVPTGSTVPRLSPWV